ncbi:glutamyl-tRNA amidotransferase, partial [Candidatus Wolfebacteria bacterium CG02_land_8_20_14_3_00_37_12]
EELSAEEIEKIVDKAIAATNAINVKDIGKVMVEAMKELKGRADTSAIGAMIKKKLENGK